MELKTEQASGTAVKTKKKSRKPRNPKNRPTKILPTDRITFSKQLDLLRAWAAASTLASKYVTNREVATIVKMQDSTVSLANPFFASIGLLEKGESGYRPSVPVHSFNRAYEWNKDTASHKLKEVIERSWFGEALSPRLGYGPLEYETAIAVLAEESHAQPEYRNQLKTLLDYMEAAGLVQRDGDQLRAIRDSGVTASDKSGEATTGKTEVKTNPPKTSIATTFSQPTAGVVNFHVDVRVDMEEFGGWPADRITAFFSGIAQVLAAKAKIEKVAESK